MPAGLQAPRKEALRTDGQEYGKQGPRAPKCCQPRGKGRSQEA